MSARLLPANIMLISSTLRPTLGAINFLILATSQSLLISIRNVLPPAALMWTGNVNSIESLLGQKNLKILFNNERMSDSSHLTIIKVYVKDPRIQNIMKVWIINIIMKVIIRKEKREIGKIQDIVNLILNTGTIGKSNVNVGLCV